MMKRLAIVCAIMLGAISAANGGTFTAEGGLLEPTHGYNAIAIHPELVNDGDFEGGTCFETPIWTCTTDNGCDWIANLAPLGLWNYSGSHSAWLGGFCGEIATIYTYICQEVNFSYHSYLTWYWLGYINSGGEQITVTIDGSVVFTYITDLNDHLLDYQVAFADIFAWGHGVHTLCFNYDLNVSGDNYFLDYVELQDGHWTPNESMSFSTIKAMY